MSWSDEELRSLYRERAARSAARRGCPEGAVIARVALGEAEEGERAEVAGHVADCSDCALELQSARRSRPEGAVARQRGKFGATAGWVAAAALVVLALVPLLLFRAGGPPRDVTRGGGELHVQPAPDATLAAPPKAISWPEQPGATGYRVRLLDARGEPVWESGRLAEPRTQLPDEVLRALTVESAAFVWSVEVEGDVSRRRLGPYGFRIVGTANR